MGGDIVRIRSSELKSEIKKSGMYDLVSIETDEDYYLPFAKIIETGNTLLEFEEWPFVIGRFVDIFPLDLVPGTNGTIKKYYYKSDKLWKRYLYSIANVNFFDVRDIFHKRTRKNILAAKHIFFHNPQKSLRRYLDFIYELFTEDVTMCTYYNVIFKNIFELSLFKDLIKIPFEDVSLVVPKDYDKYLTICYGDWRQLPPIEKRVVTHERYYYNMKEKLTIDQIRDRIKKGEYFVL